jgi:hypothetical protein
MPDLGFITDRVDANVAEPSDAPGVEPSETDPFASDRLPPSGANLRNTTSLARCLVRTFHPWRSRRVRETAAASARVLTPSLVSRLCT